jgi:glycosyltransferase 2 family protein
MLVIRGGSLFSLIQECPGNFNTRSLPPARKCLKAPISSVRFHMRLTRTAWLRLLQATLSISLLYYLIQLIDWVSVGTLAQAGIVYDLWPGPVILLFGLSLAAERWRMILKFFRISLSRFDALSFYLAGTFYGLALPGVLGGDVVRIALCRSKTDSPSFSILSSVTIERGLGLWGVSLIGSLGTLMISSALRDEIGFSVQLISPAVAIGVPLSLLLAFLLVHYFGQLRFTLRFVEGIYKHIDKIVLLARDLPASLALKTLFLSTAFQSSDILIFYYFGSLLQIDIPFTFYIFVIPIVYLSTVLPISLGGVGIREGVLVWFLTMLGTPASDAVLLAFMVYLNRIVVALLGGGWYFLRQVCRI